MKRFLCWNPQDAYVVINPDADALEDPVFRAVHTDFPVRKREKNSYTFLDSGRDFLEEILRPTDHVIVPVVGQAGTGKSHLIRWLDLQLRGRHAGREIIYVPKARTNLRDIVYSLVNRLPLAERTPYLNELAAAGTGTLSKDAQRIAILNALNLALVNDPGGKDKAIDAELETFSLAGLRAMFTDPHIRSTLSADGGFAAELAAHVFEKPDHYRPAEERREFRDRDLPLQVAQLQNAAHATREFLGWLMGLPEPERRPVVQIVNRHVDWAIANCLNLSGDRLISLMLDLRRHFRGLDQELVLLIEDFARLQGLDRPLLQSIIEQRPGLCVLRTVFASTIGFYESIESTIKTRTTFVVDMDAQESTEGASLDRFVAGYMNALRWGESALRDQWAEFQGGLVDFSTASKCEGCTHRERCHANFGQVDGKGLYPLTKTAISAMAQRADDNFRKAFNPRTFLKHVLRPTALAGEELTGGGFPPPTLLNGLGGRTMPPAELSALKRSDPQQWERRAAFLELWGDTQEARNLEPWLHEAFDLPVAANLRGLEPVNTETSQRPPEPIAQEIDPRITELHAWNERGATLKAATAQRLRDLVFEALREYIDWDHLGIARTPFVGSRGAFKPGHISFKKQATQAQSTGIRLEIPTTWDDENERLRTTLALEGLLEASIHGDWSFPNGIEKLASLMECLKVWGEAVVDQCRRYDLFSDQSDFPLAALEARAILQALMNTRSDFKSDHEVIRYGLLALPDEPADFVEAELTDLVAKGRRVDASLRELVGTRFASTKGGTAGDFIDASRCLALARSLRRRRFLPDMDRVPSADRRDLADAGRQFIVDFARDLPGALRKEAEARLAVVRRCEERLGNRVAKEAVLQSIQRIADVAGELHVSGLQGLTNTKVQIEAADVDEAMTSLRTADADKLDPRTLRSGVGKVSRLLDDASKELVQALDKIEAEVTGRLRDASIDPHEKPRLLEGLSAELGEVGQILNGYADGNNS